MTHIQNNCFIRNNVNASYARYTLQLPWSLHIHPRTCHSVLNLPHFLFLFSFQPCSFLKQWIMMIPTTKQHVLSLHRETPWGSALPLEALWRLCFFGVINLILFLCKSTEKTEWWMHLPKLFGKKGLPCFKPTQAKSIHFEGGLLDIQI